MTEALKVVAQGLLHYPGNVDLGFRHGDILLRTG